MTETTASLSVEGDTATIYTASRWKAQAIERLLDAAGADWERKAFDSGFGSWRFTFDIAEVPSPDWVLKAS